MSDIDVLRESDAIDERVIEEIEALQAILMDEIVIKTNESPSPGDQVFPVVVESVVLPSTAADADQQYVRVTVALGLPAAYPDESPYVVLRNPRGLADEVLSRIEEDVKLKCADFSGQPVIYEIIELVKEHLTSSNCPSCVCAVCLFGFQQGDAFSKTECFHYFHSHCLACYVRTTQCTLREEREKLPLWQQQQLQQKDQSVRKTRSDDESEAFQVPCPVCREPISADLESLSAAAPPKALEAAPPFEVTKELRALQHQMADLYLYQKSRGGIIDVNAEQNKLLLLTSGPAEDTTNASVSMGMSSAVRAAPKPIASNQSRGNRSCRGSGWSNSSNQQDQRRTWNARGGGGSRRPGGGAAGAGSQESSSSPVDGQSVDRCHEEDDDSNDELPPEGGGKGGGGRRGRGGHGRWSYHRSRGRRASRGRLRVACGAVPSS
ncbi:E3 ubiquitin-protein ligase RNF25 [Ischnura elegans]|uniref:E3 ubiquitin-protein ligase RNF25 n=1 Tax=Ischnura elegans TaxID=197161 RepID=UPI001ED89BB0|nr:E3 ubiquitin-protein ligase RNF25 [Ischnura elegans]